MAGDGGAQRAAPVRAGSLAQRQPARSILVDAAGGTCSPDTIQPVEAPTGGLKEFGCSVSALQTQRSRRKRTSGDLRQDVTERLMFTMVKILAHMPSRCTAGTADCSKGKIDGPTHAYRNIPKR